METNLLDRMLNAYHAANAAVTITLQNKIRVSGKIRAFDSYVIIMEGHKREILYRHAVSSITSSSGFAQEEVKRPVEARKPVQTRPAPRPAKPVNNHKRPEQPAAPLSDSSLNNSMKEGLLKWMQEQRATK